MTRYEQHAQDLIARSAELHDRAARWVNHPKLYTRVDGVKEEVAKIDAAIPKAIANAKWAKELYH